jgi:hypothetical protein
VNSKPGAYTIIIIIIFFMDYATLDFFHPLEKFVAPYILIVGVLCFVILLGSMLISFWN